MNARPCQGAWLADPPMTADEVVRFVLFVLFAMATVVAIGSLSSEHPGAPAPQRLFTIRKMIA